MAVASRFAAAALVLATSIVPHEAAAIPAVALTASGTQLLRFDTSAPAQPQGAVNIVALQAGEILVGIDVRPRTGTLYGVGRTTSGGIDTLRTYRLDPIAGTATLVGAPIAGIPASASYGVDFNPAADRLRVVNAARANLRINPNNGVRSDAPSNDTLLTAGALVGAAAYDRNVHGTTATTLFAIDGSQLARIGGVDAAPSPNGGVVSAIGPLGFDVSAQAGFDIVGSNVALAVLRPTSDNLTRLYRIDLATGAANAIGLVENGTTAFSGFAVLANSDELVALTSSGRLLRLRSTNPRTTIAAVDVTGLGSGETLAAIDFRPATRQLYGLAYSAPGGVHRVQSYVIDPATGAATPLGVSFTGTEPGTLYGYDFNPVADRIRVVHGGDENFRINPNNGLRSDAPVSDSNLTPAGLLIEAVAYDRNRAGATMTTLFGIARSTAQLVTIGSVDGVPSSPNTGMVFNVGPLGVTPNSDGTGFDISRAGRAYAAFKRPEEGPKLYVVELAGASAGTAFEVDVIGDGTATLTDIAVVPQEAIFADGFE